MPDEPPEGLRSADDDWRYTKTLPYDFKELTGSMVNPNLSSRLFADTLLRGDPPLSCGEITRKEHALIDGYKSKDLWL